jgi:hypothetical protein
MNHHHTPSKTASNVILSSPPSQFLSRATCEGSDLIQRSSERRQAFARAHNSLICDSGYVFPKTLSPVLLASLKRRTFFSKKALDFQFTESVPVGSRNVSFGGVDVHSITPRPDKAGAIGLCVEQQGSEFVVRSLNPDGPAAADGRIVPGDLLIAGLRLMSFWQQLSFFELPAVNGSPVSEMTADSLSEEIAGDIETFVDLTLMSCWYAIQFKNWHLTCDLLHAGAASMTAVLSHTQSPSNEQILNI